MAEEAVGTVTASASCGPAGAPSQTITTGPPAAPTSAPPVTTPQKTEAPAPITPEPLDPDYVARAGRWKLGEEVLRQIPQDVFERINAAADAEVMENLARVRRGPVEVAPQPVAQPAPFSWLPGATAAAKPVAQPDGPFAPVELKFEDADDDSPVVQSAKTLNEGMTKNFNALYKHVDAQIQEIVQAVRALHEFNDATVMDGHLSELGGEWEDVFGKGPTFRLDSRSRELEARQAYKKAILEHLELDASLGRERNPTEAMLRARYRLYGQKIAQLERANREAKAVELAKTLPAPTGAVNARVPAGGLRESVYRAVQDIRAAR